MDTRRKEKESQAQRSQINLAKKVLVALSPLWLSIPTGWAQGIPEPPGDPGPQVLVGHLQGEAVVDNTGKANYTLPLAAPPGTAGMQPELSIRYDSRAGNGPLGTGFSLGGLSSITRTGADRIHDGLIDGIDFDAYDRFLLDGKRLILISTNTIYGANGSEYRTELDEFSRIVLHGEMNSGGSWFEVRTKSGLVKEYGNSPDSFVEPSNTNAALTWAINRTSDTVGNYMDFVYDEVVTNGEHRIASIQYTGNTNASLATYNSVEFIYEDRPDPRFGYVHGAKFNVVKRLERIEFHVENSTTHAYELEYKTSDADSSQLVSIRQTFANGDMLPATLFRWSNSVATNGAFVSTTDFVLPVPLQYHAPYHDIRCSFDDVNGDGLVDYIDRKMFKKLIPEFDPDEFEGVYLNTGAGWKLDGNYFIGYGNDFRNANNLGTRFVDLNADGYSDYIVSLWNFAAEWIDWEEVGMNTGSGWNNNTEYLPDDPIMLNRSIPSDAGARFVDFNGDGRIDLLQGCEELPCIYGAFTNTGTGWMSDTNYPPPSPIVLGPTEGMGVHFVDLNGDALPDMLHRRETGYAGAYENTGSGWDTNSFVNYLPPYPTVDDSDLETSLCFHMVYTPGVHIADVNGDGLPDFLFHEVLSDGTVTNGAFMNTGTGWKSKSNTNYIPPVPLRTHVEVSGDPIHSYHSWKKNTGSRFVELNGDGLVDFVCHTVRGSYDSPVVEKGAWLNTGAGWKKVDAYDPRHRISCQYDQGDVSEMVDVNGDGLVDQVYYHANRGDCGTYLNTTEKAGLLKQVVTGYRTNGQYTSSTEFFYKPLTDPDIYTKGSGTEYPAQDYAGTMYVVSEMAKDNGFGDRYYTMYTYAHARTHRDRGFLGFQIFESYDPQTRISQVETLAQDFPLTGLPLKTETRYIRDPVNNPGGELLKEVENTYLYDKVDTGNPGSDYPLFYYVAKSTERQWELGNTNDVVTETTTYNWFDNQNASGEEPNLMQSTNSFPTEIEYGEITKVVVDYGDGQKQVTENTYYHGDNDTRWLLGRLSSTEATHSKTGFPDIVKTVTFDYYAASGLLATETAEPGSGQWLASDYLYDMFGNITNKVVVAAGVAARSVQRSQYEARGRFVAKSWNALGHETSFTIDPGTGAVESQTGPNGLTTYWQNDALGRPTLETRPDGTTTATTHAWEDGTIFAMPESPGGGTVTGTVEYAVTTLSSGSSPIKVFFDRKGRTVRTETEAPDGRKIFADVGYDEVGRQVVVSEPYFTADAPDYAFTEYDALNRPNLIAAPDGTKTAFGYAGLVSSVTNNYGAIDGQASSRNQVTTTEKNAKGQTVKVTNHESFVMAHVHDAIGNLIRTVDPANNVVEMQYDLRGNKIRMDDPDMGEWFYGYNALGELVAQTNANNQVAAMEYDLLGRMVTRTSPEGTAEWHYDNVGEGGKTGALWREDLYDASGTNLTYRKTYAYDALGRPLLSLFNIDNKWYYTTQTYDEFSRLESTYRFWRPQSVTNQLDHHWNSFQSINTYNERGAITQVTDGSGHVWWSCGESDFDARGNLLEYAQGNNVVTTKIFDPDTGRLTDIGLSNIGAGSHAQGFEFDRLGNLTQRTLSRTSQSTLSETCEYDVLNRLNSASVPSVPSVVNITYNAIGNITAKGTYSGYVYGIGNAGPHAVSSVTDQSSRVTSYTYDNCGNLMGRSEGGTNTSSTAWTSFNKPKTIYNGLDGSEFGYDANQNRIVQISFQDGVGRKKLYIAGFEQTETLVSSNQLDRANWEWAHTETRVFVASPVGTIGIEVRGASGPAERRYLHRDHLGSVIAVSGEAGSVNAPVLAEFSFDAWGNPRNPQDWTQSAFGNHQLSMDRGFTGHEMLDNVELVHMNGRIYDPALGRFLSPDPLVQAPGNLQSYNRYAYVWNNPLRYTDPSGFSLQEALSGTRYGGGVNSLSSSSIQSYALSHLAQVEEGTRKQQDAKTLNSSDRYGNLTTYTATTGSPSGSKGKSGGGGSASELVPENEHGHQANDYSQDLSSLIAAVNNEIYGNPYGNTWMNYIDDPYNAPSWITGPPSLHDEYSGALDAIGLVDPTGLADGMNAFGFLMKGEFTTAGLSAAGIIGLDFMKAGKYADEAYVGVREASRYLQDMGVSRIERARIIQSFDISTMSVKKAGKSEFGIRYFSDASKPGGSYLFETFPASRQSLALKPDWNSMTGFKQYQVRPGTTVIEGAAAKQGPYLEGGQTQKFILNWSKDLVSP